jgi:hypothetical protein
MMDELNDGFPAGAKQLVFLQVSDLTLRSPSSCLGKSPANHHAGFPLS